MCSMFEFINLICIKDDEYDEIKKTHVTTKCFDDFYKLEVFIYTTTLQLFVYKILERT